LRFRKRTVTVHGVLAPTDATLRALAEPRRRAILRLVRDAEMAAGQIAAYFDVTRPAISQHLTILRAAGMIEQRREGTRRLYRAKPEAIDELRVWLDQFWGDGLQRLRDGVEEEARSR
jgi:DNA-binding transcriptional ArsR family regulator